MTKPYYIIISRNIKETRDLVALGCRYSGKNPRGEVVLVTQSIELVTICRLRGYHTRQWETND